MTPELREKIRQIIAETLATVNAEVSAPNEEIFLVETRLRQVGYSFKIFVSIDSDSGVRLQECANFNKKLREALETQGVSGEIFVLEVGSPGVGEPLRLRRQYAKNVGRRLEIVYETEDKRPTQASETQLSVGSSDDESETETLAKRFTRSGKLLSLTDDALTLEIKKRKNGTVETLVTPFARIVSAKVLASMDSASSVES